MSPSPLAPALALALVLVGCVTPAADVAEAPNPVAGAFEPFHLEGTVFLEPSSGNEPSRHEIPFPVNATGRTITVAIALGERYMSVELPSSGAQYTFELHDPAGEVLAEATRDPPGPMEMRLEAPSATTGEHKLVSLTRGGSDGNANGQYFAYAIDVA